jgi:hypothetical protein
MDSGELNTYIISNFLKLNQDSYRRLRFGHNATSYQNIGVLMSPRKDCIDCGKTGEGNIITKEKYGEEERYPLKCRTCSVKQEEPRGP